MAYGTDWRNLRKSSHALLNATSAVKYQPIQDFESKQTMMEFLNTPERFYEHNRRYSSSVIMLLTYGYRLPKWDHPLVKGIYTVLDNLTEMTAPGAHAVDSFPSLANLPQWLLGNWRSHAEKVFEHDSKVYMDLWQTLKKGVDEGKVADCFCKDYYLSNPYKHGIDEKWYKPAPHVIGWHAGLWNLIGAVEWILSASFGYCSASWCEYQGDLTL